MGMDDDDLFLPSEASRVAPEKSPAKQWPECKGVTASKGGETRSDVLVNKSFTMGRAELRGGRTVLLTRALFR